MLKEKTEAELSEIKKQIQLVKYIQSQQLANLKDYLYKQLTTRDEEFLKFEKTLT